MRVLLIKSFLIIFSFLPLTITQSIGTFIGWFLNCIPNELRRVTRINIAYCFPNTDAEFQHRLTQQSLIESAKTLCEMGAMWSWSQQRILQMIKSVSGEDLVTHALQQGNGLILVLPHLGNWELTALYCSTKFPMTTLYSPPKITALDKPIHQARGRFGASLVPTNVAGIRKLYKTLADDGVVAILPDQEPRRGEGQFASFFDRPAYTMVLLNRLARKTNAPLIFCYAERLQHRRGFHLHFVRIGTNSSNENLLNSLNAMNKGVEECIQANPEQYQWSYKRFRIQPNDNTQIYTSSRTTNADV